MTAEGLHEPHRRRRDYQPAIALDVHAGQNARPLGHPRVPGPDQPNVDATRRGADRWGGRERQPVLRKELGEVARAVLAPLDVAADHADRPCPPTAPLPPSTPQ